MTKDICIPLSEDTELYLPKAEVKKIREFSQSMGKSLNWEIRRRTDTTRSHYETNNRNR